MSPRPFITAGEALTSALKDSPTRDIVDLGSASAPRRRTRKPGRWPAATRHLITTSGGPGPLTVLAVATSVVLLIGAVAWAYGAGVI